jgi:hypothetical protein
MKRLIVVTLVCIALAGLAGLTGCKSSSEPSSDQARKVVETSYQDLTPVGAKIIDFRKQNGEAKVVEAQKTYVYHFLVAFELPAGIGWRKDLLGLPGGFAKVPLPGSDAGVQIYRIPAGATAVGQGTITFRETEQGWTGNLDTRDDGYCPPKTPPEVCYKKLGWDKLN